MEAFFVDYFERLQGLNRDFIKTFEDLPAEALDWIPGDEMNSLCVLVVHTTAATRFWIGDAALGESSNRNRAEEFQARGLSAEELKARFTVVENYARGVLERITFADLPVMRGFRYGEVEVNTGWALLHALEHIGLHLGHTQITRQLGERRERSVPFDPR